MKNIFIILLLTIPTFSLMLKFGIHSMHDFHLFRQFQFNKCFSEGIFPCRWAPDAALGYGQPLFNFYGQFPYMLGQVAIFAGLSIIDSVKFLFILSLVLSGFFMYLLSKKFWGTMGGIISAIFYVYAPYRAVDVWVRGALPEALAFVFFPLILYLLEVRKHRLFALFLALLIITHNLSFYMFLPFLCFWWLIRSRDNKFILAGLTSLLLASFYLLPVVLESSLISLSNITKEYYNYPLHYTTLFQLFVTRAWGYGGSIWGPNDTMSFSVGHLHWGLPLLIISAIVLNFRRLPPKTAGLFAILVFLGLFSTFLTHGKSEFIWKLVPGMEYIQFPWRFLTLSAFFFSLSAGAVSCVLPRYLTPLLLTSVILLNFSYFAPDTWRAITDSQAFSGPFWDEQRSSAPSDYWPSASKSVPVDFAPTQPKINFGDAALISSQIFSHSAKYQLSVASSYAKITFPVVYFPGWTATANGSSLPITPSGDLGLISIRIPQGTHTVELKFKNTFPRALGNALSLAGFTGLVFLRRKNA